MSTLLPLRIPQGTDWSDQITIRANGIPVEVTNLQIAMRRDVNLVSPLLASFVEPSYGLPIIGPAGLVVRIDVGVFRLSMTYDQTSLIPAGTGFWDGFGFINGQRARVAYGAVVIIPGITAMQPGPDTSSPFDLDGGNASSTYTDGSIDGGNASSTYVDQGYNGGNA